MILERVGQFMGRPRRTKVCQTVFVSVHVCPSPVFVVQVDTVRRGKPLPKPRSNSMQHIYPPHTHTDRHTQTHATMQVTTARPHMCSSCYSTQSLSHIYCTLDTQLYVLLNQIKSDQFNVGLIYIFSRCYCG
jgi:hypothetical protein